MTEGLRLAWCMFTCRPRPRSLSSSWAISPLRCVLLCSRQGIVGHLQQDFDTGTHLSDIYLYVTNVSFCLFVHYPIAPFAIQAQAVQKSRTVVRSLVELLSTVMGLSELGSVGL